MLQKTLKDFALKKRSDVHLTRKIWHMLGVLTIFLLYSVLPSQISLALIVITTAIFVPLDLFRLKNTKLNDFLIYAFRPIMRKNEVNKIAGTTYLLVGVMVVIAFFPTAIASMSILFLAFADPIASYFGIRFGKDKLFGHKSLQGFMAAYSVCFLVTLLYLFLTPQQYDHILTFSLIAGLIGALAELIPIGKIDDNFTLPVVSALGLRLLFFFFGF